jgi:methionyl-tRNA formyltransferase
MRVILNKVRVGDIEGTLREVPIPGILRSNTPVGKLIVVDPLGSILVIDELQPAGKKAMTAEEFLRGHPAKPDMRFGPETLS